MRRYMDSDKNTIYSSVCISYHVSLTYTFIPVYLTAYLPYLSQCI